LVVALLTWCGPPGLAQAPESPPAFEVATVKKSSLASEPISIRRLPGGRLVTSNTPLTLLITWAFQLDEGRARDIASAEGGITGVVMPPESSGLARSPGCFSSMICVGGIGSASVGIGPVLPALADESCHADRPERSLERRFGRIGSGSLPIGRDERRPIGQVRPPFGRRRTPPFGQSATIR